MEFERFSYQVTPFDEEELRRIESRIAGYRVEPAELRLHVGQRHSLLTIRVIPIDHRGRDMEWQSARIDGTADSGVARLNEWGAVEAVGPGRTDLALTPGYRTASGERVTVHVRIYVAPV